MKKFILIVLVFGLLIGGVSIPFLMPLAKMVRSHQHMQAATNLKEQGDDLGAFNRLMAARNLTPDNRYMLSTIGPYAADLNHPSTLRFWTNAADLGLLEFDGVMDMVEYGLKVGEPDMVRSYLYQAARDNPTNERVKKLQLRILAGEYLNNESRLLARDLIREGSRDIDIFTAYVEATFSSGRSVPADEQEEALATLRNAAAEDDDIGIYSLRTLLSLWDRLTDEEKDILDDQLRTHPQAELSDRLSLIAIRKANGLDEARALEEARRGYEYYSRVERDAVAGEEEEDKASPRAIFCDWLNAQGYSEVVLEYLSEPDEIEDSESYFARQIALISTGQYEAARDATLKTNPLTPTQNLVSRAFAQSLLGEPDKASLSLSQAVESVNINEVPWLEQVIRRFGRLDLAIEMYETLETRLANPVPVQLRLLALYYQTRQEDDLQRVARAISLENLSGALADELSVLYFCILYRPDRMVVRRHVEELSSNYPNLIEPRVYLALAYAISGNANPAGTVLEGWEGFNLENNRFMAITLAHLLLQKGETDKARGLVERIPTESLLDRERFLLSPLI